jgi:hypothetical protein
VQKEDALIEWRRYSRIALRHAAAIVLDVRLVIPSWLTALCAGGGAMTTLGVL